MANEAASWLLDALPLLARWNSLSFCLADHYGRTADRGGLGPCLGPQVQSTVGPRRDNAPRAAYFELFRRRTNSEQLPVQERGA